MEQQNWTRVQETEDALYDRAVFCLRTGVQPSEYDAMTDPELQAFIQAFNDIQKKS